MSNTTYDFHNVARLPRSSDSWIGWTDEGAPNRRDAIRCFLKENGREWRVVDWEETRSRKEGGRRVVTIYCRRRAVVDD